MRPLACAFGISLIAFGGWTARAQAPVGTAGTPAVTAYANLVDTEGRNVGQATFRQTARGVLIRVAFKQTTPGSHAMHVHEVGRCDRPTFESAGAHFNPTNRKHGFGSDAGMHAGDLPNIEVPPSNELTVEHFLPDVTIAPGPRSLLDSNGSSLVIHAGQDDHASDPAGASGDRLACGPILPAAR